MTKTSKPEKSVPNFIEFLSTKGNLEIKTSVSESLELKLWRERNNYHLPPSCISSDPEYRKGFTRNYGSQGYAFFLDGDFLGILLISTNRRKFEDSESLFAYHGKVPGFKPQGTGEEVNLSYEKSGSRFKRGDGWKNIPFP